MQRIGKKMISVMVTIVMMISMLGINVVQADTTTQDLIIAKNDVQMEIAANRTATLSITKNTTMIMKGNATFSVTSGNAIKVTNGVTLTIILNGYTLDVKTNAKRMAGILLPRNATLIVREGAAIDGKLNVQGGPGGVPTNGGNGDDGSRLGGGTVYSGRGGGGGNGADAPGAGIGGDGGIGGEGSSSPGSTKHASGGGQYLAGDYGGVGNDGKIANNPYCGNVYIFGQVTINTNGGVHNTTSLWTTAGGKYHNSGGPQGNGGGGGGNGGSAHGASGIGGGGVGGGGGGAGGGGSVYWEPHASALGYAESSGGGGGGGGQTGGQGGQGSQEKNSRRDGSSGGSHLGGDGGAGENNRSGAGSGGRGGASPALVDQGSLGYLYYDTNTKTTINNSKNSTSNSATNRKLTNKIILLSECIIEIDDSNIIYDGNAQRPDIILKDKNGNTITSQIGTNYTLEYKNNIDAGEKTGIITIKSNGSVTDNNYLLVDGGSYDIKFTIKPNEEPLSITKADTQYSYVYGKSFQASVNKHTQNKGIVTWDTVVDEDHKVIITGGTGTSSEIIATKVGEMKLQVTITQNQKNANGVYNFPEIMTATLEQDIQITPKNIDDSDVSVPNIGPYTYAGGQIKPTYATDAYKSGPIEFNTNKDTAHKILQEGVDFELEYGENTNVADGGTVKIKGIGNYNGDKSSIPFTIEARDINDGSVTTSAENPAYTGNALQVKPVVKITDTNMGTEYTLPDTDYVLSWDSKKKDGTFTGVDLTNVGEKQITIVGAGNLNNSRTQEYQIVQADIGTIDIGIERAKDVYFDGKEIESRPTIRYYDYLLTEQGTTTTDQEVDVPNPDDYEIAFGDHKEVGETTTTITGVNNFKGTRTLTGSGNGGYDVVRRPLYILPDMNQWKYYGAKDIYGEEQMESHPTYQIFTRALNAGATEEKRDADITKDEANRTYISDGIPIVNYPIELIGALSREGAENQLLDTRDTTYKYTIGDIKLTDATKKSYQVKLVDNESTYKVKSYLYDGTPAKVVGIEGKNDWYVEKPVEFQTPTEYTISKSDVLDPGVNNWTPSIHFDDGDYSKEGVTYFLQYHNATNPNDPANGAMSNGIVHKFKQDTVLPTGSLTIASDAWTAFNTNVGFNYFLNKDAVGLILAKDDMSKVDTRHYYISDSKLGKDELDSMYVPRKGAGGYDSDENTNQASWIQEDQFQLKIKDYNTKRKYMYIRIEDTAGNVSYINSDGIVFDKDAPILNAEYLQNGVWTISPEVKITGTVSDENAGLKDRYVAYQMNDGGLQVIKDIQSNGNFEIKDLPDGKYTLTISAWDKADNEAAPRSFEVMKDTQTPRILLQGNTTTIATQQAITFDPKVGPSGISKVEVSYNGGEWKRISEGVSTPYLVKDNGVYTFRITNGAGVVSKESSIEFTKIDTKIPTISVEVKDLVGNKVVEKGFTNSDLQVVFTNTEKNLGNGLFEYSIDDGRTWIEVTENLDNEAKVQLSLVEGKYTMKFRVTAQNGLQAEKEFDVSIDRTIPKMNITVTDATGGFLRSIMDQFRSKRQVVKANGLDEGAPASGVAQVEYYIVEGKATKGTLPIDAKGIEKMVKEGWTLGEECEVEVGSDYVVYFKVTDQAGNIAYGRSDRIVIDDAAPEIDITYELVGQWDIDPKIEVYVYDANPGVDQVSYQVDGGAGEVGSESFTIDHLGLINGEHNINIQATDKSGNTATKEIKVKVDTGVPTITANALTPTVVNVPIEVEARYEGLSKLDKILVSKNGQDFEDITDMIQRDGQYIAQENGDYIFRAVTGAGGTAETTVHVDAFTAIETDIEAVVHAKVASGEEYTSETWTNQEVTVTFSNHKANLKGLSYQVKTNNDPWEPANTVNGYLTIPLATEGIYQYAFKVIHTATGVESKVASIKVHIDKTSPTSSMKIKEVEWTGNTLIENGFTYTDYFNKQEYAKMEATDSLSGIERKEIFMMKEADIPSSIKGQTTASKIEALGNNRWLSGGTISLDPNEKYVVFGKAYDKAGNVTYVSSNGVVFDDINPTVTSDINQNDWYKDNTTDIHFNVDDNLSTVKEVKYTMNNGSVETAALTYDEFAMSTNDLQEGENKIDISVFDYAGNEVKASYLAKKDTEMPTVRAVDNVGGSKLVTKNVIEVQATAGPSKIAKVEVKKPDAGGWDDITDSYATGYVAQEKGTYWFRVINGAGNSAVTSVTLNNISKDIPLINYLMISEDGSEYFEGNWSKDEVKVQFTNQNGNQTVEKYLYKVDDGRYQEVEGNKDGSAMFTSEEGHHTYTMKLILDNGLESEEERVTIQVDAIAPKIQVNSDLSQWVKETQELEVEVVDSESGVDKQGYSFDNGYTWQSENKMMVRANKIVGVKAKDAVANISSEKASIEKIDSQGPTVASFKQLGTETAKVRELEANIEDYCDLTKRSGSGIAEAYVMTTYPYKDGEANPNPSKTFAMEEKNGSWVTKEAVSVPYNGTNSVWLVTEDQVGNEKIYSIEVTNMIGSGDEEGNTEKPTPGDPTYPENPENPKEPSKPGDIENPGNGGATITPEGGQSGTNSGNTSGTASGTNGIQSGNSGELAQGDRQGLGEGTTTGGKSADALSKVEEDTQKLMDIQKTIEKGTVDIPETKRIYRIAWILLLFVLLWGIYLTLRYRRIKHTLVSEYVENQKESEGK